MTRSSGGKPKGVDLRVAAEEGATAEGRSVADVVVELLGSYIKPKPRKKTAKKA